MGEPVSIFLDTSIHSLPWPAHLALTCQMSKYQNVQGGILTSLWAELRVREAFQGPLLGHLL